MLIVIRHRSMGAFLGILILLTVAVMAQAKRQNSVIVSLFNGPSARRQFPATSSGYPEGDPPAVASSSARENTRFQSSQIRLKVKWQIKFCCKLS